MNEKEANEYQRRKFALEQAIESRNSGDTPERIILRAKVYDGFLREETAKVD